MKKYIFLFSFMMLAVCAIAQYDWDSLPIAPSPGSGNIWELQTDVSDDFNYDAPGVGWVDTLGDKWINFYHNDWTGPKPTLWKRDHVSVSDGKFKIRSSRTPGNSIVIEGKELDLTNLGCATSVGQVVYPVYVETRVKIMNSVLASDVWLLSSDDTQEIDICEAYGGERWTNPWFSDQRLHLSHHVFIRSPFQDWQPSDEGSFYTDGSTIWRDGFHTIGVYWMDSINLRYYVDGQLVRSRSGMDEIDPLYFTNRVDPGNTDVDTRQGLSKPMDIILNTEDQTWRALQDLTPTEDELSNEENNTFEIDWVRVYKPVEGAVGPVTGVTIEPEEIVTFPGNTEILTAKVEPNNALDLSVIWESLDPDIATVNQQGEVSTLTEGTARIVVTTNDGNLKDTAIVSVTGIAPSLEFENEFVLLNFNYFVGSELPLTVAYHAGSGNTITDGGQGGVKFWLREIAPGWVVVNDYTVSDDSAIGEESGMSSGSISLEGVPATAEIPEENWYFLYVTFFNSDGEFFDKGIFPIKIVNSTSTFAPKISPLEIFPNPTQAKINIKNPTPAGDHTIQIINSNGQIVEAPINTVNQDQIQLDIEHLSNGVYIIKIVSGREVHMAIFVKQN